MSTEGNHSCSVVGSEAALDPSGTEEPTVSHDPHLGGSILPSVMGCATAREMRGSRPRSPSPCARIQRRARGRTEPFQIGHRNARCCRLRHRSHCQHQSSRGCALPNRLRPGSRAAVPVAIVERASRVTTKRCAGEGGVREMARESSRRLLSMRPRSALLGRLRP